MLFQKVSSETVAEVVKLKTEVVTGTFRWTLTIAEVMIPKVPPPPPRRAQ
jgi:hypothetical protein